MLEIQALPPPEVTQDKTFGVLLLVLLIVSCGVGGALATTWWVGTHDLYPNLLPPSSAWDSYASQVWPCPQSGGGQCAGEVCYQPGKPLPAVYYFWDMCPQVVLEKYPVARRLEWPVARGERYRLAAYRLQSSSFTEGLLRFMAVGTLNARRGVFPGWMVSVYEPSKLYSDNPFLITSSSKEDPLRCNNKVFSSFRWVEVLRSCDRVLDASNVCESGGQTFYHAPGTGVWYNLGNCLVRYNKLDALLFLIANAGSVYSGKSWDIRTISPDDKTKLDSIYNKLMLQNPDCVLKSFTSTTDPWTEATRQLVSAMTTAMGDVDAFAQVVKSVRVRPDADPPAGPCIFYRDFYGHSDATAAEVVRDTTAVIAGTLACSVAAAIALLFALLGRTSLLLPVATLVAAFGGAFFLWKVQLRKLIDELGYVTLAAAVSRHSITVARALDLVTDPTPADDPALVQAFSGMPATRVFDDAIEALAVFLGYDCVVMHTQPNVDGSYAVEIIDVTRHTLDSLSKKIPWAGGLCAEAAACTTDASYTYARGGLCWNSSFGSSVFTGSQQASVFQRLSFGASSDTAIVSIPKISGTSFKTYVNGVQKNFANWQRASCTCANETDYRCLSCAGSASKTACSVPK